MFRSKAGDHQTITEGGAEMDKKQVVITLPRLNLGRAWAWSRKWLLPNPGTLMLILVLALAAPTLARQAAAPAANSVTTIPYQGRLADLNGDPITDRVNMEFRLYDVPTGGTPLWEEFWTGGNAVNVSDGLFSVMLGSLNPTLVDAVQGHDELYLGITVGTDSEMEPRVQLGSVPFSVWSLTVADDSITADKIAAGAVGSEEIATDAVGSDEIAAGAVGNEEIAAGAVTEGNLAPGAVNSLDAPDGAPQDAVVVDEEGKVGIGTADPTYNLQVIGSALVSGRLHVGVRQKTCSYPSGASYADCSCDAGEVVIAGGTYIERDDGAVRESRPMSTNTWRVACVTHSGSRANCATINILCARLGTD